MKARNHLRPPPVPAEPDIQPTACLLWEEAVRDQEFWFAARERLRHAAPVPAQKLPSVATSRARNAQPVGPENR